MSVSSLTSARNTLYTFTFSQNRFTRWVMAPSKEFFTLCSRPKNIDAHDGLRWYSQTPLRVGSDNSQFCTIIPPQRSKKPWPNVVPNQNQPVHVSWRHSADKVAALFWRLCEYIWLFCIPPCTVAFTLVCYYER